MIPTKTCDYSGSPCYHSWQNYLWSWIIWFVQIHYFQILVLEPICPFCTCLFNIFLCLTYYESFTSCLEHPQKNRKYMTKLCHEDEDHKSLNSHDHIQYTINIHEELEHGTSQDHMCYTIDIHEELALAPHEYQAFCQLILDCMIIIRKKSSFYMTKMFQELLRDYCYNFS